MSDMKIKRILVPVDFSDSAANALEHAIEFAKAFNAEIHLLHSYPLNPAGVLPYGPAFPVNLYEGLHDAAKDELSKVGEKARAQGVEVKMHLSQNIPSNAIVDAAEELDIDLIVMGTRGLTGLKHVLLGSVAERTVRLAPCPVLTVSLPHE